MTTLVRRRCSRCGKIKAMPVQLKSCPRCRKVMREGRWFYRTTKKSGIDARIDELAELNVKARGDPREVHRLWVKRHGQPGRSRIYFLAGRSNLRQTPSDD